MTDQAKTDRLRAAAKRVEKSVEIGTPDFIDLGVLDELIRLAGWAAGEIDDLIVSAHKGRSVVPVSDRLREALEAVQSEVVLTGHLAELVETALHG